MDITVILQADVAGLGEEGDVKTVAGGYARNYLLPRKLAVHATRGNIKILDQQREVIAHKQEQHREEARGLADRLAGLPLRFEVRVGEQGRLYGSVTAPDIANRLKEAGIELDRRTIELREPLRSLGEFDVPVRVAHAVTAHLKVTLHDQNAPAPTPVAVEPAAQAAESEAEPTQAESWAESTQAEPAAESPVE